MKKLTIVTLALLISNTAFSKDDPHNVLNQRHSGAMISDAIKKDNNSEIGVRIETPIKREDTTQKNRASELKSKTSIELYGLIDVGVTYTK